MTGGGWGGGRVTGGGVGWWQSDRGGGRWGGGRVTGEGEGGVVVE